MRTQDHSKIKNSSHHAASPALFDHYYLNGSDAQRAEPKTKTINEEGWQLFAVLCFGCLILPALIFP